MTADDYISITNTVNLKNEPGKKDAKFLKDPIDRYIRKKTVQI